jgi:hypothetical protein
MLAFCMVNQEKEIISIEDTGLAQHKTHSPITFFAFFLALFFTFYSPQPSTIATVSPTTTLNKQLPLKPPAIESRHAVQLISRTQSPFKLTNGKQGADHDFFHLNLVTHTVIQRNDTKNIPRHNDTPTLRSQYFYIGAVQPRSPPRHFI